MNTSNKLKLTSFLLGATLMGATGATAASSDGKCSAGKCGGDKKAVEEQVKKTADGKQKMKNHL